MPQKTGSADGNRGGPGAYPDHLSHYEVFAGCGSARIGRLRVPMPRLCSQHQQQHDCEAAGRHTQNRPKGTKINAVQLVIKAKSLANFRSSQGLSIQLRTITIPHTKTSQAAVTISTAAVALT